MLGEYYPEKGVIVPKLVATIRTSVDRSKPIDIASMMGDKFSGR